MQDRIVASPLKGFSSTTTTTNTKAGPLATFPAGPIILFAGGGDPVTDRTERIRACTDGNIRIDTPEERYWLSPAEVRDLLFFGRQVLLRQDDGIIDGEAIAYPHQGGQLIVIALYQRAYEIPRYILELVAKGIIASIPITPIPWT